MATYKLQIVTQEKIVFDGEVTSLIAPGELGYLGVMAQHAPLLAALGKGDLTVRAKGGTMTGTLEGGFLEVQNNVATILADRVEGDFLQSAAAGD
jgi:F-type H+-transporting ATPase subunit epsilon